MVHGTGKRKHSPNFPAFLRSWGWQRSRAARDAQGMLLRGRSWGKPKSCSGNLSLFSWRSTEEPAHLLPRSHFSQGTRALAQRLF